MEQRNTNRPPTRSRSRGKRRKVRYDRIVIALAIVVVILVLLGSCTCSCVQCVCAPSESSTAEKETEEPAKTTSAEDEDTTSVPLTPQNAVSMTLMEDDMRKGPLAVVNESTQYHFPSGDVSLVSVYEKRNASYSVSSMDVQLDETVVNQLNLLLSEFSTLYGNDDIQVTSGYRSKQDQQTRYSNGSSIFPGGYSDYHTGRSLDLCIYPDSGMSSYYVPSGDYTWITEHAADYGFVVRYPDGKVDYTGVNPRAYTFHYVGLPHSAYMYKNDMCLEEYVAKLKEYPSTEPLNVDTGSAVWTVFYVELSPMGGTVINIPSCQEYTISGDNMGGFIVAYH